MSSMDRPGYAELTAISKAVQDIQYYITKEKKESFRCVKEVAASYPLGYRPAEIMTQVPSFTNKMLIKLSDLSTQVTLDYTGQENKDLQQLITACRTAITTYLQRLPALKSAKPSLPGTNALMCMRARLSSS